MMVSTAGSHWKFWVSSSQPKRSEDVLSLKDFRYSRHARGTTSVWYGEECQPRGFNESRTIGLNILTIDDVTFRKHPNGCLHIFASPAAVNVQRLTQSYTRVEADTYTKSPSNITLTITPLFLDKRFSVFIQHTQN